MPADEVMHKWKHGLLKSHGRTVTSQKQAEAIMFSERAAAAHGKKEYQSKKKKRSGWGDA
jgi:hypothetical protein